MNRQALRSVANTDIDDTHMTQTRSNDGENGRDSGPTSGSPSNLNVSTLAEDGKALAERSYAYATRTIHENPTLALAGVVAVGALVTMALMPRRTEPRSVARHVQRDLVKHTRDLRKIVRQELRESGATSTFNDLSKALANVDWKPYVQPIIDQASSLAQQANAKLTRK